jgi:hypothetical protein
MAQVNHYEYHQYDLPPFQPGTARTRWYGPWPWTFKGVVVTAAPFNAAADHRALEVTDVQVLSEPAEPSGDLYVSATFRNVGLDPIVLWYVTLVEIAH